MKKQALEGGTFLKGLTARNDRARDGTVPTHLAPRPESFILTLECLLTAVVPQEQRGGRPVLPNTANPHLRKHDSFPQRRTETVPGEHGGTCCFSGAKSFLFIRKRL